MEDLQKRKRTQTNSALLLVEQIRQYLEYGEYGQAKVNYGDLGDMARVMESLRGAHSLLAERSAMRGANVTA